MGADGALQLALNYPDVFGVVGAHSPVLRTYEMVPGYFGDRQYWAEHAPVPLIEQRRDVPSGLSIWLDAGDRDTWLANVTAFHNLLSGFAIVHEWRMWPGGHDGTYWGAHLMDCLRFYGSALKD